MILPVSLAQSVIPVQYNSLVHEALTHDEKLYTDGPAMLRSRSESQEMIGSNIEIPVSLMFPALLKPIV